MSEDNFLSRWSRRKRAAEDGEQAAMPSQPDAAAPPPPSGASDPPDACAKLEDEFDLSTLPPIDSITAVTDVTAFLRKGVPLELTRAALRRAWTADPAIRDFVGLAENAWDFNDPNAMPGFGPLDQSPEQVRELVARIVGGVRRDADVIVPASGDLPPSSAKPAQSGLSMVPQPELEAPPQSSSVPAAIGAGPTGAPPTDGNAAPQNESAEPVKIARTHGGALPR